TLEKAGIFQSWQECKELVSNSLNLNRKQYLAVKLVTNAMESFNKPVPGEGRQLLLYLGGEGGTGKSRVIAAIERLMELMGLKHKIQLAGSTGAAADNIGGSTVH